MNTPTLNLPLNIRNRPYGGKRRLLGALAALLSMGFGKSDEEYQKTLKCGYRHGKHNGQTRGAFGKTAAKSHRSLYVGSQA